MKHLSDLKTSKPLPDSRGSVGCVSKTPLPGGRGSVTCAPELSRDRQGAGIFRAHWALFLAITTDPITATSNKTDAISKGTRYSEKSTSAIRSVFPGAAGTGSDG